MMAGKAMSGPTWTGAAMAVLSMMSTAVHGFKYNETLDPWNMNKNKG
jgi:hypothetical protein